MSFIECLCMFQSLSPTQEQAQIFEKASPALPKLAKDAFGNFVIQKLLDSASEDQATQPEDRRMVALKSAGVKHVKLGKTGKTFDRKSSQKLFDLAGFFRASKEPSPSDSYT